MSLKLVPVNLREARRFVGEHHRHNDPPLGWKFGVGVENGRGLVGVAIGQVPVARMLNDGRTLEVTRVCTLGDRNANSMLYGAIIRAGKALGYQRFVTYTLESESGSSVKAVGFTEDGWTEGGEWSRPSRPRVNMNLFGETKYPTERKRRWVLSLTETPDGT